MEALVTSFGNGWNKLVQQEHVVRNTAIMLSVPLVFSFTKFYLRYRAAIRERLRKAKEESFLFGSPMIRLDKEQLKREADSGIPSPLATFANVLVLNPNFCEANKEKWSLVGLGAYLNSLRSNVLPDGIELPNWIQDELEAMFAIVVSKRLGPYMGAALLPALGSRLIEGRIESLSNNLASTVLMNSEKREKEERPIQGGLQLDLFTLSALTNINQKMVASRRAPPEGLTSLDKMRVGEVGYELSFAEITDATIKEKKEQTAEDIPCTEVPVPNPFVVLTDWETTIAAMEALVKQQDDGYDPDDRSLPAPQPVNERLLPDLYFGWGLAECTHSRREIIQNRLLAVILNRLAYNLYLYENGVFGFFKEEPFRAQLSSDSTPLDNPHDFIQALVNSGHVVELCPRVTVTTFGQALCIKEKDGSWSNVPLAAFLDSGYETKDGKSAKVCMPHGGIDLEISGPLLGTDGRGEPRKCNIQHYLAIEGLCGWHSNHNADVPWIKAVNCCDPWRGDRALHAVRLAGLTAVVANAESTEMRLPLGGYGLVGVCNDSAAFVEQVMEKTTNIYPLMSTARFLVHAVRRLRKLRDALESQDYKPLKKEIEDINLLMAGTTRLRTDLHASLANCKDSGRRMIRCLPKGLPFLLNVETKEAMEDILTENHEYETYG